MWQVAKATVIRNQVSNRRAYPWAFTFGHIISGTYLVLVSFFAYHFLIRGQLDSHFLQYTGSNDYLTFAIIGGLLGTISVSMMMNVSRALITEWREGTLEVLLLSPAHRSGYLLGTTVQQLYRLTIEFVPALTIGLLLGLRLSHANWLSVVPAFLLYLFACFSMALVLGAVMLYTRDTYLVQNTLFSITTLVCGFQFPTQYLPTPLQWSGQLFPLTQSLHLLRASVLTGASIWNHGAQIGVIAILSLAYCIVGLLSIKHIENTIFERAMA